MSLSQSIPVLEQEIKYLRRDLERARDDKHKAEDDLRAYLSKSEAVSTAERVTPSDAIMKLTRERDQAIRERDQADLDKQKAIAEKEQAAESCTAMRKQVKNLLAQISENNVERADSTKRRQTTVEDAINPSPEFQASLARQRKSIKQQRLYDGPFGYPQQPIYFPGPTAEEEESDPEERAARKKAILLAASEEYRARDEEKARKLKATADENAKRAAHGTSGVTQKASTFPNPFAPKSTHTDEPGVLSLGEKRKADEALLPSANAPKKRMTIRQRSPPS